MTIEQKQHIYELLRREGLIVVAIAALGWQVYWLTNNFAEQDAKWRTELASYREMMLEDTRNRLEKYQQLVTAWTRLDERVTEIGRLVTKADETCRDAIATALTHEVPTDQ